MLDQADWVESFDNEADRESYERWVDGLVVEEQYVAMQAEKLENSLADVIYFGSENWDDMRNKEIF